MSALRLLRNARLTRAPVGVPASRLSGVPPYETDPMREHIQYAWLNDACRSALHARIIARFFGSLWGLAHVDLLQRRQ